jgi:hypothetical protein
MDDEDTLHRTHKHGADITKTTKAWTDIFIVEIRVVD